jgi:hypothetical protein
VDEPEPEARCGELDQGEIALGGLVVAGGDGAELLKPVHQPLHPVAEPVQLAVERGRPLADRVRRDDRQDASQQQLLPNAVGIVARVAERGRVSRDVNSAFDQGQTFGGRLADRVASFGGSWAFIALFLGTLVAWVALNSVVLARHAAAFDPYPYVFLNLVLSMLAALQAPVILMAQNRQAARDRLAAGHATTRST